MRRLCITAAILGVVTMGTIPSLAQSHEDDDRPPLPSRAIPLVELAARAPDLSAPDPAARQDELEKWIHDFTEWKTWMNRWGNRREPGWFSDFSKRRQRPDPPAWLFDRCGAGLDDTRAMAEACTLLTEWRADAATAQVTNARAAANARKEESDKTIWWEHVHLDVAWPAMQSGVSYFGVIGMHATTSVRGRLEIFVAPGAMLLNVPTRNGARAWKVAANYGIAYRLGEFGFPGNRRALLHVNLAKAWLLSAGPDVPTKSTDFVGFSVTFKKAP
jgi:hypothetical protein